MESIWKNFNAPRPAQKMGIRTIAKVGMLGAIATILMLFEIPLWFAPSFYEIDLSEVMVLIGGFALGPVAGMMIEAVKVLLNVLINGTITGGIGELANFLIGSALVVPASLIYRRKKSVKWAVAGMGVGILMMTIVGGAMNYFVLLPVYAIVFGMPIQSLVEMGTAVNANITDLYGLVLLAVVPFNLLKGILSAVITLLIYKKISPVLHK